ncbi:Hsp20/alpha crystallin family protein [Sulfurimonas sp.]|uniref:Hsp20/alpha crystallin family protein n=1 Tax=Sulfurimonas sp. TaxID=2022749 RepID=UPI0025EBAAD6|nr:Hsp20/alpha crystallin family protein [Sulfurimonas sp.]MCK9474273.1 Hsp20/alpha crystallin family protein [Sulfurimonas sp.]
MRKTEKDLILKDSYPLGSLFNFGRFNDLVENMYSFMDYAWNNWSISTEVFETLQPKGSFPKINVFETDKDYTVEIAVAGFEKDDVNLELKDNCLFIKSDKKEETCSEEDPDKKCLMKEVSYRSFRRVIRFASDVDTNVIDCNYKDGIIKCVIGKKIPEKIEEEVTKIEIK